MTTTIFDDIVQRLVQAKIPSPRLETRMMMAYVLETDASLILPHHEDMNREQLKKLNDLVSERINHRPLCKILGQKAFYKYDFKVNEDVLSPRPDTEILVETAIETAKQENVTTLLDLGTGSGCILLSVLGDCPWMTGVGVDVSSKALDVAKINAEQLGLNERCHWRQGSWNDSLDFEMPFDMIVSNPPYIPSADIRQLDVEVKDYDPLTALDGGEDGYRDYRILSCQAKKWLKKDGKILLEVGFNQAHEVKNIFEQAGWTFVDYKKDLSGIERCVILKK